MRSIAIAALVPAYVLGLFSGDPAQFGPALEPMIQGGYLETSLEDYLVANNGYWVNSDVDVFTERYQRNRGVTITRTRPGLKAPVVVATDNTAAQTGPNDGTTPSTWAVEQYTFTPFELSDGQDLDLIGNNFAIVDQFQHDVVAGHQQALQSVDLLARDTYIAGYATGCTIATVAAAIGTGVAVHVDDVRGFDTVVTVGSGANSTNGKVVATSSTYKLPITVYPAGATTNAWTANCELTTQDNVNASNYVPSNIPGVKGYGTQGGPTTARGNGVSGTITIDDVTRAIAIGDVIVAGDAPPPIISGGGLHFSKLENGNYLLSDNLLDVVSMLANNGVPFAANRDGDDEGTFVAHIAPSVRRQLYRDPDFKQANQTLARSAIYTKGKTSEYLGVTFLENTNIPRVPLALYGGTGYAYLTIVAGQGAVVDAWYEGLEDWATSGMNPAYVILEDGIAETFMPAYADRQGRNIHIDWLTIRDMVCPTDVTRSSVVLSGNGARRARAAAIWTWSAT